jgi:hypothetical protein
MKTLTYQITVKRTSLVDKSVELLDRYLLERYATRLQECPSGARLILDLQPGIGAEGFLIEDIKGGTVRLAGNDERGLLYAIGKYLRMPPWRGQSVPDKAVRGMYFATHFHNYYHNAPLADVQRYIEELALWGCNALQVWFDMHEYTGIDDPKAQAMIQRLTAMMQTAQAVGIRLSLGGLANESFSSSPPELRADWTAGHDGYHRSPGGHYHMEICPSMPGGLDLILQYRRQMLEAFRGLDVGYFWLWPYDQGGCTCSQCAPWGINGYLKASEAVARLAREIFPKSKTVLSTWYFDHFINGEWEGLDKWFATRKPKWVDYLMADDCGSFPEYPLKHGIPGGLPVLSFPEISMDKMGPWGGYGANPRIAHWQQQWNNVGKRIAGGFPYSEGIFEDLNKVLLLQLGWDGSRTTREIAGEYVASEFSAEHKDDIVEVMEAMEAKLEHHIDQGEIRKVMQAGGWQHFKGRLPHVYTSPRLTEPVSYANTMRRLDKALPPAVRTAWRWRVLWLRAALDEEIQRSAGRPTTNSEAYFDELAAIYHTSESHWYVTPPSMKALTLNQRDM